MTISTNPFNIIRIRNMAGYFLPVLLFSPLIVRIDASVSQVQHDSFMLVPVPHPMTSLLRAKEVQHELGMSAAQIDDVKDVINGIDLPLWRLRDLPLQKRNAAAGLLIQQLRDSLAPILSSQQMKRLKQLTCQAEGIVAVLEPEVMLRLDLSGEQSNKIHTFLKAFSEKRTVLQRNTEIRSESRKAAYLRKLRVETEKNLFTILNSDQQRTLRRLMGRPFDLSKVRIVACKAPEFEGDRWINQPEGTLPELTGKVTVIHFYAFGCGNCIRTLPYYNQWREYFPANAFQIIGIHRPETERERQIDNVRKNAAEAGIEYLIAIDNESLMWDAWANHTWPSIYLVDKNGFVRYWWYGELNWQGAESEKYLRGQIQALMDETP